MWRILPSGGEARAFGARLFLTFWAYGLKSRWMETYLRIRNNLFLVSFWKRAPFSRLPAFQAG